MPMADSRCCSLCGYWHSPGSDHISPLRTYGHCARCGNEHSVGPCPQLEGPTRFPSRAEREAIHEMQQSEERARAQWGRERLIEEAVRDVRPDTNMPLRAWATVLADHVENGGALPCLMCDPFVEMVRARFRELAG